MRSVWSTILAAAIASVLTAGFFAALPGPLATVNLTLILVIAFITDFRFKDALIAAVVGGLILDLASAGVFGTNIVMMCIVTMAMFPLFTRVFTNRSLAGLLGMAAVAFTTLRTLRLFATTVSFWLAAYPVAPLWSPERLPPFIGGLLTFMLVAAGTHLIMLATRRGIGTVVMTHRS